MEIEHRFNFNDPVEVTEIFRYRKNEGDALQEYGSKASFAWEDIMFIKEYPFHDDWEKYSGPKYYVRLRNYSETLLILGEYESIVSYWKAFRNKYPLFTKDKEDED